MSRLTINIDDELHNALKETAARTGRAVGSIVEDGLRLTGVQSSPETAQIAARIIDKARRNADLGEDEALALALEETRQSRKAQRRRR